jgi:hypothetical protein
MVVNSSRKRNAPQAHRQGWKSCLIMVGFLFTACAKPGEIKNLIKMPELKSTKIEKEQRSACEIELDRVKDDLRLCRDDVFDYKYSNRCGYEDYE